MAIDLVAKYLPYVDEIFATESKHSLVTNNEFSWNGAHSVKIYKVSTSEMNDYDRNGANGTWSRYGTPKDLNATTKELDLKKDRSFTYIIDKLDNEETGSVLNGSSTLARQQREVVIPEVDEYVFGVMCSEAESYEDDLPAAVAITADNIYELIVSATEALDNAEVPESGRVLLVTPGVYRLMKECPKIVMNTDIGADMRLRGVIANIDGAAVVKVPESRLPEGFGFMMAHPCATVAPKKLEDYKQHEDPPGINGTLCEGRICYDAFVLPNKHKAIYYQKVTA